MLQIVLDSFTNAYGLIEGKVDHWVHRLILLIPNLITATIVFVLFLFLGRFLERIITRLFQKANVGTEIVKLVARIIYFMMLLAGFFFSLGILQLDKTVTSLLAGAGILGLALSFAFQDIATNFVSGFIIALRKPFRTGDLIDTNGFSGTVTHISLRAIHIRTFQGQDVIIPSKDVLQKPITNFATHHTRRVDIPIGVSYGDDLEKAAAIVKEAVASLEEVDPNRPVEVYYNSFGDSSINMTLMFWIDLIQNKSFMKARHDAIIAVHKAFNEKGITIPFPIRTLDFGIKGGETMAEMLKATHVGAD